MRSIALAALAALAPLAGGCGGSSVGYGGGGGGASCTAAVATATNEVSLSGMEFVPSCVKIAPGASITFTNADSVAHTVTTDPGQPEAFNSGPFGMGQTFTHQFASSAETVHVHCSIHPSMTAAIIVQ